jgi:thiol-disulfide isomerase/thioredoxin
VTLTSRADAWAVTAQLVAGWIPFPSRHANGAAIDDPTQARLDLGLATLLAGFGRGEGVGAEVQVPVGVIGRGDVVNGAQTDVGFGDLEARGRYLARVGRFRLQGMVGVALPTGAYAARSGEIAILENARYLTLGRGTTWALADVDARVSLPARIGLFVTSTARVALADARDGLRWGPEVRATAGGTFGPLVDRVSFAVGLETQWRAQSSEIDPFTNERLASVNTGGLWLTATPSVQVRVVDQLTLFVASRVPVWQRTEGLQFIPSVGVFAGFAGSFEVLRPAPPLAEAKPAPGRVTVVDYWATWCAPCLKLKPVIDALEAKEPRVTVRRVDASDLDADALEAMVPGAAGLPIVEVFRADGSLAKRLVGDEVFQVEDVVKEVLQ